MSIKDNKISALFKTLDKLFWLIWLAFPVLIILTVKKVLGQDAVIAVIEQQSPGCAELIPQVGNFSSAGKLLAFTYLSAEFAFYAALLGIAHMTIHHFARGRIFVEATLRALGIVGLMIAAWPVFDLIALNIVHYAWTLTNDMKSFEPHYLFDVGPFGVGLLILTLRAALQHAIALKQENELTI